VRQRILAGIFISGFAGSLGIFGLRYPLLKGETVRDASDTGADHFRAEADYRPQPAFSQVLFSGRTLATMSQK